MLVQSVAVRWCAAALALALAVVVLVPETEGGDFISLDEDALDTLDQAVTGLLDLPLGYDVEDGSEFEYVVVGAGAAGSAVAARLTLAGKSVLLLEAGNHAPAYAYVPAVAQALIGSRIDWNYNTRSNNVSCLGFDGEQCRWARGKTPGGSTTINYMMYVRGNRQDYELGVPGWTWSELEPYFLRAEGLRSSLPSTSDPYHNTTGPVRVGFCPDTRNAWHTRFYEGFQQLGFPENPDVNAESQIGVSKIITFTNDGLRETTALAYLAMEGVKNKLKLSLGAHVTKVIFDDNNVASGVNAIRDITGQEVTVKASKGVILSAGTIGTPQILMLSGIGPKTHLEDFDIPVRSDLPVGDGVSDHALPFVFIRVDTSLLEVLNYAEQVVEYALTRDGPLASIGLTDITAFLNSTCYDFEARTLNDGPGCDIPTLQYLADYIDRGTLTVEAPIVKNSFHFKNQILEQLVVENLAGGLILTSAVVLHPYSRGTIRLASSDPLQQPDIFPNYLDDERDVDEMVKSITILEHLVETEPFKGKSSIVHLELDGCPSYDEDREQYWRCYVRHLTFMVYHAAGSCPLGTGLVLDERLQVRGVSGLRVGDLSALPQVPHGNTAAVTIAIGERLADFLLEDEED